MARQIEKELSQALRDSNLNFIRRGTIHLDEVYEEVRKYFWDLCDESYTCLGAGHSKSKQEEWKHVTRNVMSQISKKSDRLIFTGRRGYWEFR